MAPIFKCVFIFHEFNNPYVFLLNYVNIELVQYEIASEKFCPEIRFTINLWSYQYDHSESSYYIV